MAVYLPDGPLKILRILVKLKIIQKGFNRIKDNLEGFS